MAIPDSYQRIGIEVRAATGTGILHQLTGVIAQHEGDIESVEPVEVDTQIRVNFHM